MLRSLRLSKTILRSWQSVRPLVLRADRYLLTLSLDLVVVNIALLIIILLHPSYSPKWVWISRRPYWFITLSALWVLIAHANDAYTPRVMGQWSQTARAIARTALTTAGIYLLIPYITPMLPPGRRILFAFPLLLLGLTLLERRLVVWVGTRPIFRQPTLILGTHGAGQAAAYAIAKYGHTVFEVVGFVTTDAQETGQILTIEEDPILAHLPLRPPDDIQGRPVHLSVPVVGDYQALTDLIRQRKVTTLVLAIPQQIPGELLQVLMDCVEMGVEIIPMAVLYEQLTARVPIQYIEGQWYAAMPISHPGLKGLYPVVKRLMDITVATAGLLVLGLLLPFIALAIYLDDPGPILYTQQRVGRGGRLFTMYKFRSMIQGAEPERPQWAQENDPRVTRVGRILRKTHLDEFPQFINVFKGDMSLIGPRPERPEFVEELSQAIPFYKVRHAVRPGMAGWALVNLGYASSYEESLIKLQYDLYYIKHQSIWLDIIILLKAVVDTLTLRGR